MWMLLIGTLSGMFMAGAGCMVAIVYLVARDSRDRWGSEPD